MICGPRSFLVSVQLYLAIEVVENPDTSPAKDSDIIFDATLKDILCER
jgi:hypothetical protein